MTNEEAAERLRMVWNDIGLYNKCLNNSFTMAIKALEKQIPKKPYHSGAEYDCPTCLGTVGFVTYRGKVLTNHHCKCGQAIDWSGTK